MQLKCNDFQINLSEDEAVSLLKILGSLTEYDIKNLKGPKYTCGDVEISLINNIFNNLSAILLSTNTYNEVFTKEFNNQVKCTY